MYRVADLYATVNQCLNKLWLDSSCEPFYNSAAGLAVSPRGYTLLSRITWIFRIIILRSRDLPEP